MSIPVGEALAPETRKYLEELGVDLQGTSPWPMREVKSHQGFVKKSPFSASPARKFGQSMRLFMGHAIAFPLTIRMRDWNFRPFLKFLGWALVALIGIPMAVFLIYTVVLILIRILLLVIGSLLFLFIVCAAAK